LIQAGASSSSSSSSSPSTPSLPVRNELHAKVIFRDHLNVLQSISNSEAPLLIWDDRVKLDWSTNELADLQEIANENGPSSLYHRLLHELPTGVHMRPYGNGNAFLMLWEWAHLGVNVPEPPHAPESAEHMAQFVQEYPDLVVRGLTTMIPALKPYITLMERKSTTIDGGNINTITYKS
jgi:hypothetical protein